MALDSALLCDPSEKPHREAANGVEQLDYLSDLVNVRRMTELRESHVLELQSIAVRDIYPCAGRYRDARMDVRIGDSEHKPPDAALVPALVRDSIDYINNKAAGRSGLERAAYALWKFNWIHPFAGGNGRTSRAITYLILCMDLGAMLPGVPTVPKLIYHRRDEYVLALKAADKGERETGNPDLSVMTEYLQQIVTHQMANAIDRLGVCRTNGHGS